MKKIFFLHLVVSLSIIGKAQEISNYNIDNYSFIGYYSKQLMYINWEDNINLYKPKIVENAIITGFKFCDLKGANTIWFINDDVRLDHSLEERVTTLTYKGQSKKILNGIRLTNTNMVAYSKEKNLIILAYDVATTSMLVLYNLTNNTTEFLPIIGRRPVFSNGYLYFSSDHICDWYSAYIDDIYRVKIGDWNKPELILQNTEPTWSVLPNSNIIYADILEDRTKRILFNADTKTYAITNYFGSPTIVKLNNNYYYQMKQYNKPISFKPIKFADSYPHKDERILCPVDKKKVFNLPNHQKQFTNTFITDELMYNASKEKLNKLTKKQLGLLRNAFYARQGYDFKNKDLKSFYSQFEWYEQLLKSNKFFEITNNDIVILEEDKQRIDLIKEIENSKK